ncbi:MAG: TetR family transcriptional regulator [Deltaproteobacteria bacterium]|nr:TetR family transcriptional regulator [Deltaproteobacteria bacterium]MCB9788277.1 TetR family transcriptional regulator [Deltaproteobacteria bacterium]
MEAMTTVREQKKALTRDALVAAAWALFSRQGFEATTVDDIAQRADVSRRTFFRYFPSKESVVFPRHEEQLGWFLSLLADAPAAESPYQTVRRACVAIGTEYMGLRAEMEVQRRVIEASPRLIAYDIQLDQSWEVAIAHTLSRDGTPPDLAAIEAGAILGMIRAVIRAWLEAEECGDLPALGAAAFDHLASGVGRRVR